MQSRIKAQEREIVKLIREGIEFFNPDNIWYLRRVIKESIILSKKYPILDTTVEIQKPEKLFNHLIGEHLMRINYNIRHITFPEYTAEGIEVHFHDQYILFLTQLIQ